MGERNVIAEYQRLWQARKWMKKNEPFLQAWHAHLGYSLDLFKAFEKPVTAKLIAERYSYKEDLLERWVEVGLALGYLKGKQGKKIQSKKEWLLTCLKRVNNQLGSF